MRPRDAGKPKARSETEPFLARGCACAFDAPGFVYLGERVACPLSSPSMRGTRRSFSQVPQRLLHQGSSVSLDARCARVALPGKQVFPGAPEVADTSI